MKEKILVFDSTFGYAKYFEKIYKKKYEVITINYSTDLKNLDIFYFDTIIFMANELEDVNLFSKIHSSYKGIRMFLELTKLNLVAEVKTMNLKDIFIIKNEMNKTEKIDFINSKLTQEAA